MTDSSSATRLIITKVCFCAPAIRDIGLWQMGCLSPADRWGFLHERYIRINNAGNHADVEANEVGEAEHVVPADVHPYKCDQYVFQASDDRGRKGRVVQRAHDGRVHEQESHETRGQEG